MGLLCERVYYASMMDNVNNRGKSAVVPCQAVSEDLRVYTKFSFMDNDRVVVEEPEANAQTQATLKLESLQPVIE